MEWGIPNLIIWGSTYLYIRKKVGESDEESDEEQPAQPAENQFDDMEQYTWKSTYFEGDDYVWKYGVLSGIKWDNGEDTRHYEYYWLVGNSDYTSFVKESDTSTGHKDINGSWAKIFDSEQSAKQHVDDKNAPATDGPTAPQGEPQEEEDDDPSFPNQGGWMYQPRFIGGGF